MVTNAVAWKRCVVAWAVTVAWVVLAVWAPEPAYRVERARIENGAGNPLQVVVFLPSPAADGQAPGAVLCQPINNPPEFARPLALELVRAGFVVLTFDWRGQTPEENRQLYKANIHGVLRDDARAAVDYLRDRPEVDADRVAIAGHSVGGNVAVDVGIADPRVAAVACIGMAMDVPEGQPRNLLWAAGLYDEFRSPNSMHEAFEASAAEPPGDGMQVGDFAQGTARGLALSPTADHFTELLDWRLQREVVRWFRRSVGLEPVSRRFWVEFRGLAGTLAWLAALLSGLLTARHVLGGRRRGLRAIPLAAIAGIALLGTVRGARVPLAADLVLYLLVFTPLAGYICSCPSDVLERGLRRLLRVGLVLWASVLLTLLVNALPAYVGAPRYALFVPEFAVRHALGFAHLYGLLYSRQLLFASYAPTGLAIHLWVYVLPAVELMSPGCLLRLAGRLAQRRPKPKGARRRLSPIHVAALGLLLVALTGVVWLRLRQGFVTGESTLAALRFIGRFGIVPIGIFAVLWRVFGRGERAVARSG